MSTPVVFDKMIFPSTSTAIGAIIGAACLIAVCEAVPTLSS
jgi:hypothetical protein